VAQWDVNGVLHQRICATPAHCAVMTRVAMLLLRRTSPPEETPRIRAAAASG
jgi:hypothetical protein